MAMRKNIRNWSRAVVACGMLMAVAGAARATETENLGIRILPVTGPMTIDGKVSDWDLSGGIFACGDAENGREKMGVWFHAMYDADNLYLLARWRDVTPMNNPGSTKGDYGFNGDCLQFRIIVDNKTPTERCSHWTCWIDREGLDAMGCDYGKNFDQGGGGDVKKKGSAQAFLKDEDAKGYAQEIRIPWKVLTKDGAPTPKAGDKIRITLEPNFTIGTGGRLTIKDVFMPGAAIDRVFTFMGSDCWGEGKLVTKDNVTPQPIRLRDGREFAVRMEKGVPVVDWSGLIKTKELQGFKTIKFTMPDDGFASLNIYAADGTVARQLLEATFTTKGTHEVKWDGLTSFSAGMPGRPVAPGEYSWKGIYNTGIGLRLKGWADNAGSEPWTGPKGTEDWGGDHGNPMAAASDGGQVYLGWEGAEGGKSLVAVDTNGIVKWRNNRGGIATAAPVAADGGTVYAFNNNDQYAPRAIYRLDAKTGRYNEWTNIKGTDLRMDQIWAGEKAPTGPSGMVAKFGKLYVGFSGQNAIKVIDGKTGEVLKTLSVQNPGDIEVPDATHIYVATAKKVVKIDTDTGAQSDAVTIDMPEGAWTTALALDAQGKIYVGLHGANQVYVYTPDGKHVFTIGRKGGRALLGPWTPDGLLNISGMTIDGTGKLWVTEDDGNPKRVSAWNTKDGTLFGEFFGPSSYGGTGASVNPVDPNLMVGQGAEWRIDPKTGRSSVLGTINRTGSGNAKFGFGPNGKLYLATAGGGIGGAADGPVCIQEKISDGNWKMRTIITHAGDTNKGLKVTVWSDENDDGIQQPNEVKVFENVALGGWINGWYMPMTPSLTFYGSMYQVPVSGWTACGAPQYDFTNLKKLPGPPDAGFRGGMGALHNFGSADDKMVLWNGSYGEDHSTLDCYDIATGKFLWTYPNNYTGVHGSHRAGPPEIGLIRGAYDVVGVATLPAPLGNVWIIATNKGEWHMLSQDGYYVTHLFESDPIKVSWPDKAVPGAIMDLCPPGAGEESFGGAVTLAKDGKMYLSAGHTSFMDVEVVGLETVKSLPESGKITISGDDIALAKSFREKAMQGGAATKRLIVKKATPDFTGELAKDFDAGSIVEYFKQENAKVRSAMAWDDKNLYVGWEVQDDSPWVNGADAPENMYNHGDTVDLQLATAQNPDDRRTEEQEGDIRLSIGTFQGKPTAVLYRRKAKDKHELVFSSGVVHEYHVDSVSVLKDVKITPKVGTNKYIVETAIPLSDLGFTPEAGKIYRGDLGTTHADKSNQKTGLRTEWSNQDTGLVSDAVFELRTNPKAWGEFQFVK